MAITFFKLRITVLTVLATVLSNGMAAPPDLTSGGVPNETPPLTFNLGPTGMRGWTYHVKVDTSESRQILVTTVESGSPADGILAVDDVILGASGTGAAPAPFSSDARKSLAYAIADAEASNPASLKLLRWRAGNASTVTLTLQTLGAYSATAPYNCPKSAAILQNGLQYVYNNETSGRYSFGAISLLATGNATYSAKAQTEARALIPTQATMDWMMRDEPDTSSMITWQRGYTLVFLAEYYLATGDAEVLPAIRAYAVNISKNRSLFGTVGHKYAQKDSEGNYGPMGGVYGVVNQPGLPCFLGVVLAKECGVTDPELDLAIEASSRFFAYYAGKGAIPYGEHEPEMGHESNGKVGLAALLFTLQNNRVEEGKFFAKMATAAPKEREIGHTGVWYNYVWAPLGAAAGGEEAAAAHFSRISWMLDLNRCWDGRFQYDCLNGEGPKNGSSYHDFRMSTAALLTYSLPHRELRITGKNHDSARFLSSTDVTEATLAGEYDSSSRSVSELISDLTNWSPKVRHLAAKELGNRTVSASELNQITALAQNTSATAQSRSGACAALREIGDASSAAPLADLLRNNEAYVRYSAAEALRYLPRSATLEQVDKILEAAAAEAAPLYPIQDEDPLQFAHAKLGMLLFYSWSAFGPKGILWNSVDGIDRDLLYPAIRAVAKTPVGLSRGTLERTYDNLTYDDVLVLSGTIVDSVINRAPADKMFSNGVRRGGVAVLQKHGIAEGVPASMEFTRDEEGGRRREGLQGLGTFGGGVHSVVPDPDAIGFLEHYLTIGETAAAAQASLDAINGDTNPTPLVALKSITSATADHATLTLPATSTVLRVTAMDHAQGDSIYTWQKVSGFGSVTFTPNGTAAAATSTVQFDGIPGVYEFEVTMSDSRGLTEAQETVTVELFSSTGPDTTPPTLASQDIVDDQSGSPVFESTTVLYTVSFNELMNSATVGTDDFENGGSPAATINSVNATSDLAVFEVSVTPGGPGTLTLQVASGATLEDLAGNALNTTSPVADNNTLTVNPDPQTVSILNVTEGNGPGGEGDLTFVTAYDASAADKLVVVLGGEHGFPGNTGGGFNSVTYGGVALTEAVQEKSGVATLAIFYLDNPGAAGDIVVNQENHNGSLYAIYQLSGTTAGVGASNKATSASVNLTTTGNNSLVISGILNAGPEGGNSAPNMTADSPMTEDTITDLEAGSRWVSMSAGSALVENASPGTYSFSNAGVSDLLAIGAVEIPVTSAPSSPTPLKVFILAGQSNMEGHGEMAPVGTQGTLEFITTNNAAKYGHLKSGTDWATRDDVWIWYRRGGTDLLKGGLTAGYGAKSTTIGPELQFGHVMGEVYGEKVLLIKTAWGGKSLAVDYRPPTSGWSVNPPVAAGDEGFYYQQMMTYVNDVLTNLPTYFPEYDAAEGYILAGFGWHQGWNDRVNQAHNDQYEVNMKNFINDVRSDLSVPDLPFVIATTGMSGWDETHPRALSLMAAQLAMEDVTTYPAFEGNVAVVDTRDFWRGSDVSPSGQSYHWNRNAETYCLIGEAMAQEMLMLLSGGPTFTTYMFNPAWSIATDDRGLLEDPDGDGIVNQMEAWLGTNPGEHNSFITSLSSTSTTFTFTHPQNTNPPGDLSCHYEWSPNLMEWYASGEGPAGGPTVTLVPTTDGTTTSLTATGSAAFDRMFLSVVVEEN